MALISCKDLELLYPAGPSHQQSIIHLRKRGAGRLSSLPGPAAGCSTGHLPALPFCPHGAAPGSPGSPSQLRKDLNSRLRPTPSWPFPNIRAFPAPRTVMIQAQRTQERGLANTPRTGEKGTTPTPTSAVCPTRTSGRSLPAPRPPRPHPGLAGSNRRRLLPLCSAA